MSGLKVKVLEAPIFDGVAQDLVLKSNNVNRIVIANTGSVSIQSAANLSNNLNFTGTGNRITGDFSNATVANRALFQTNTANSATTIQTIPSGTGTTSLFEANNSSDPTNSSAMFAGVFGTTDVRFSSFLRGTGTYLPMTFYTGGSERVRVDTSGNVGIGTSSPFAFAKQTVVFESGGSISQAMCLVSFGGNPIMSFRQASGTIATPGASNSATLNFIGSTTNDGTTFFNTSQILSNLETTATAGSHPTFISFSTTPSGSTSRSERMRITSAGNVGIGTSSPIRRVDARSTSSDYQYKAGDSANATLSYDFGRENTAGLFKFFGNQTGATGYIFSGIDGERMRIDTSGNVGIGTTNAIPANGKGMSINGGSITRIDLRTTTSGDASGDGTSLQLNGNDFTIENRESGFVAFATSLTERVRIDASGDLLVGTATGSGAKIRVNYSGTGVRIGTTAATGTAVQFVYEPADQVGTITTTTNSTAYNTSSDYRLKENVAPMTYALATVAQLKPCTYTWKANGSAGQGFIAHELQAVVPDCVTGEKDAVDKDGKPQYQGVDTSFLVATLVSAIQELTARLELLENKQ